MGRGKTTIEMADSVQESRLDGKVAVVTGGGRGIGRAAAIRLAEAGASVMVSARTESEIESTADRIRHGGGKASAYPADVSEWDAMRELAREAERLLGPPDILVANAGVIEPVGPAWEVGPEAWARNLKVNLIGAFYTVRAFLPAMVDRNSGVLIFTSSGAATHPVVGWSAYCAAKAGMDHLVRNLAEELEEHDLSIRVHALYPGVVDTSMQKQIRGKPEERFPHVERFRRYHEEGILRPAEEPGALIWWLATPMAAEYDGRAVSIDDPHIRARLAEDLGSPQFADREA